MDVLRALIKGKKCYFFHMAMLQIKEVHNDRSKCGLTLFTVLLYKYGREIT